MREIKFRAWDTHEEVMNRVDYVDFVNGVIGMSNENVRDYEQPIHRVNIMQYTGLKDKNGVDIYEGDIVTNNLYPFQSEGKYNYHGLVDWDSEMAMYILGLHLANRKKAGISHGMWTPISDYHTDSFEVIGNIYENPELLEREAE